MCGGYNCCVSKACSACCTIWCAFGCAILFFFYLLGHYDGVCDTKGCVGNYFIVDFTTNMSSPEAGDICGISSLIYLGCSVICGGFWVYHDYIKKQPTKKRVIVDEVEFADLGQSLISPTDETKKDSAEI